MNTPDAITPIRGYRTWRAGPAGGLLAVGIGPVPWSTEMQAECRHHTRRLRHHHAPVADCSCGIYACNSLQALINERDLCRFKTKPIVGEVDLWGKIIEHQDGYRAEYARIVGVYRTNRRSFIVAARYGVPLLPRPHIRPCGMCFKCDLGKRPFIDHKLPLISFWTMAIGGLLLAFSMVAMLASLIAQLMFM